MRNPFRRQYRILKHKGYPGFFVQWRLLGVWLSDSNSKTLIDWFANGPYIHSTFSGALARVRFLMEPNSRRQHEVIRTWYSGDFEDSR